MGNILAKIDGCKTYIGAAIAGAGYAAKMLGMEPNLCDGIMGFGGLVALVGLRMAVNKSVGGNSEKAAQK